MNKQRFSVVYEKFTSKDIIPKGIMDNKKNNHMCKIEEVCSLLNEQQKEINELNQENADLLGDKIKSLDEFEKCTNKLKAKILQLQEENKQLKSLVNACEYGQKNLMEEMKNSDEALDKIWEIMKELYGVIDDE